jgi:hypothetical protein
VKVLITIPATILLLVHMQPIGHLAGVVAETTLARGELAGLRVQLVADAGAALLALLVATTLSVYKPWGRTRYGRRKQQERRQVSLPIAPRRLRTARNSDAADLEPDRGLSTNTSWGLYILLGMIGLILLFVVLHLAVGDLRTH